MLDWLAPQTCPLCNRLLERGECLVCPGLLLQTAEHKSPFVGFHAFAAPYESPYGRSLKIAKYQPNRTVAAHLGQQLGRSLRVRPILPKFDWIVPVPSPWTRRFLRGFCATSLFARHVSRALEVPILEALRVTPGAAQASLHRNERNKNLHQRMVSVRPASGRVLVVDDVLTTGATTHHAALELLGEASEQVDVLTLCSVVTSVQPS